jgi:hypothetical protein
MQNIELHVALSKWQRQLEHILQSIKRTRVINSTRAGNCLQNIGLRVALS